jgi:hypothetical protein
LTGPHEERTADQGGLFRKRKYGSGHREPELPMEPGAAGRRAT